MNTKTIIWLCNFKQTAKENSKEWIKENILSIDTRIIILQASKMSLTYLENDLTLKEEEREKEELSWYDIYEKPDYMIGMIGLKNAGKYFDQSDVISEADKIGSIIEK